jgi:hypothetical protein
MAHNQEIMGLNPDTVYWIDVSVASYYINIHKQKIAKNKGTLMGYTKKIFFLSTQNSKNISYLFQESN